MIGVVLTVSKSICNNNIYKTLISKISTVRSNFLSKSDSVFYIFYKNINGLSANQNSWRFSYKYQTLRWLWQVFDPNLIAIIETQLNPALLDSSYNILESLFQSDLYIACLSNNNKELISKRQQSGILSIVRGELCSLAQSSDSYTSGLGR